MGRHFDSAVTRVRPFFQPLLGRDPRGTTWLGRLLRLGEANPEYGRKLAERSGPLLDWVALRRKRPDRSLRALGIPSVELEQCFEHRLPPPAAFLRWLIQHPEAMVWPRDEMSEPMQLRRAELFGHYGPERAGAAAVAALGELDRAGAEGSGGKWWAFEGFTRVDCFLETDQLILLVEGKRMEPISASTQWFPRRNQVLRNLEVARSLGRQRQKEYAVLVLAEEHVGGIGLDAMEASLPHLTPKERSQLMNHYLGCVTWRDALASVFFPQTVEDVAEQMRQETLLAATG